MKVKHLIWSIIVLLLIASLALNLVYWQQDASLSQALSEHERDLSLSLSECENMLSDLESGSAKQLQPWILRFRHHILLMSNPKPGSLDNMFTEYKAKESPGRSNYFADMVLTLSVVPHLSKDALLHYLGRPDDMTPTSFGQELWYHYRLSGKQESAFVVISNNTVIVFGLHARKEAANSLVTNDFNKRPVSP